ncbi:MAG: transglutaminase-like domain-containing protein, partial [Oscillospiraceae bacterium]
SKPNAALLILERTALCVLLAVCPMMFILAEYEMPVSLPFAAVFGAAFAAGLSVVFVFVRKLIALPVLGILAGLWVYSQFEWISSRLMYFADACMLLVEGRFLYPRQYLLHNEILLNEHNPLYVEGVTLGCVLLCIVFALICALSLNGKLRAFPPIIAFAALCAPVLISERLDFNPWIIPTVALFAACITISRCYRDGLAVKHFGHTAYERLVKQEEQHFVDNTRRAPFAKRLEMRTNYYSKYFSAGMYCAALLSALTLAASSFFGEGQSIDYSPVYEWVMNIGRDKGTVSPFEDGVGSDYFSSELPDSGNDLRQSSSLNIISPGRGERELLRVTYTGDRPIYLRGDIGVEFNGSSWTSLFENEPGSWTGTGLKELYRPCEQEVANALLDVDGHSNKIFSRSDVRIEYLTETSIVFLPNYTAEYNFYSNDTFNIYGDFIVRVDKNSGSYMNSVDCTAVIPDYIGTETHADGVDSIRQICSAYSLADIMIDDIYSTVVPSMNGTLNVFAQYEQFVDETYTALSDDYRQKVQSFMKNAGLSEQVQSLRTGESGAVADYRIARYLSDYLRDNYTYTLDTVNFGGNAVMNFLTYSKRGHCSLYASALALMLRAEGIPARYCTGFFVTPKSGSAGGTEVLREKNTHAWVEVYLKNIGWVTFDPTSASSSFPGNAAEASETRESAPKPENSRPESRPQQPTVSGSDTESDTETIEVQSAEPADTGVNIALVLPILLAVIITAAAAFVIAMLIRRVILLKRNVQRRLDRLYTDSPEKAARDGYHILLGIFEVLGMIPAKGELPQNFFERADAAYGTSLAERCKLLESIEFGGKAASDEEREYIAQEVTELYGRLTKSAKKTEIIKIMKKILRTG